MAAAGARRGHDVFHFTCISAPQILLGIPLIHYQYPATLHGSGLLREMGQLLIGGDKQGKRFLRLRTAEVSAAG